MVSVDLNVRESDGHVVVALRGELDIADAVSVAAALAAVAARERAIIVDLASLEFILSTAGLDLQAALRLIDDHLAKSKICHAVDELDQAIQAIQAIRDTILDHLAGQRPPR